MEGREQVALIAVCATAASMPGAALGNLVQDLVALAGVMAVAVAVDLAGAPAAPPASPRLRDG
ncbi:hypothetical protein J5Y04_16965 [Kitasatospora sp. RG8]|uniref:hypothetical protein n=1 Tax=Kitasatospora sp. RG8 TaxID=2820815 RepID=UPI001ADF344C|nr:hypothetical protein [Kitasatospora sp. RG8]MBP0451219.1 hypothetical protein [Kitasatospora sp. RG8]